MALTEGAYLFPGEIKLIVKALGHFRSDYEGTSELDDNEIAVIKVTEQYLADILKRRTD